MRQLCIILHYKCIIICNTAPFTFTKLWHYFFIFVLLHNISFLVIVQLSRGIFYICIFILGWNSVTLWHNMNDITWHYMTLHDITWHYMTLRDITWHYVTLHDITWHLVTWHRDNKVGPKCSLLFIIYGFGLH